MGYSFRLAADSTYHGLCYNSRGSLARTIKQRKATIQDACYLYVSAQKNKRSNFLSLLYQCCIIPRKLFSQGCSGYDEGPCSILIYGEILVREISRYCRVKHILLEPQNIMVTERHVTAEPDAKVSVSYGL